MVIPNHSSQEDYERMNALGVTQYGQMTAGSYMYIGPKASSTGPPLPCSMLPGSIWGSVTTLIFRSDLHHQRSRRHVWRSSQSSHHRWCGMHHCRNQRTRCLQTASAGLVNGGLESIDEAIDRMVEAATNGEAISIGLVGNIVELWERCVEREIKVDLGSDQTSLHNPYQGGYFLQAGPTTSAAMMSENPDLFRSKFRRHFEGTLKPSTPWQSGCISGTMETPSFEASRVGADVVNDDGSFRYPSYVEDIMGPLCFDYGFGPYRWVCTSGDSRSGSNRRHRSRGLDQDA